MENSSLFWFAHPSSPASTPSASILPRPSSQAQIETFQPAKQHPHMHVGSKPQQGGLRTAQPYYSQGTLTPHSPQVQQSFVQPAPMMFATTPEHHQHQLYPHYVPPSLITPAVLPPAPFQSYLREQIHQQHHVLPLQAQQQQQHQPSFAIMPPSTPPTPTILTPVVAPDGSVTLVVASPSMVYHHQQQLQQLSLTTLPPSLLQASMLPCINSDATSFNRSAGGGRHPATHHPSLQSPHSMPWIQHHHQLSHTNTSDICPVYTPPRTAKQHHLQLPPQTNTDIRAAARHAENGNIPHSGLFGGSHHDHPQAAQNNNSGLMIASGKVAHDDEGADTFLFNRSLSSMGGGGAACSVSSALPPLPSVLEDPNVALTAGQKYYGVVARYNPSRGFGFIRTTHKSEDEEGVDVGVDVFFHQTEIQKERYRIVKVGANVSFIASCVESNVQATTVIDLTPPKSSSSTTTTMTGVIAEAANNLNSKRTSAVTDQQ